MMKRAIRLVIAISATLALWAQVSPKAVRTADEMDPLLAKIATYGFEPKPHSAGAVHDVRAGFADQSGAAETD